MHPSDRPGSACYIFLQCFPCSRMDLQMIRSSSQVNSSLLMLGRRQFKYLSLICLGVNSEQSRMYWAFSNLSVSISHRTCQHRRKPAFLLSLTKACPSHTSRFFCTCCSTCSGCDLRSVEGFTSILTFKLKPAFPITYLPPRSNGSSDAALPHCAAFSISPQAEKSWAPQSDITSSIAIEWARITPLKGAGSAC